MLIDHFPLVGLRITTPRVQLRLPDAEELAALADVAADGVHDPAYMPFRIRWSELPPAERARSVVLHHWSLLGQWTPRSWKLPLTVFHEGAPVGMQMLKATDLAVTAECSTASWLGRRHQRQGIGAQMRAAVAHLAFTHLGATDLVSAAFTDNAPSLGVSAKLGYVDDGIERHDDQGRLRVIRRLRLTRQDWLERDRPAVTVEGLAPCLPLLGLTDTPTSDQDRRETTD
ncbi:GNAT family N-acetyltransferase [Catellatospora citrea]|uniref:Putative succinyl-CoA transferase n=1 Tax=Catellatospora citrea TaxID=53366 RepID=A0A8J3P0A5_9ACTN|nr:GNAT family N-acetyltransferase [Catellatospora citrea]RKE06670.1 RimJ/RimL family protein N-acetyltransferase [Catellatospora citrea]GIF98666.1 putative succinyl-CoA transferase [Catellatospora citrea]